MKATVRLAQDDDWHELFDAEAKSLLVPGAKAAVGDQVTAELVFPQHGPIVRMSGRCTAVTSEGLLLQLPPTERPKVNYVNAYVRGGMLNVRRRPRVPVRLDVAYGGVAGTVQTVCRDINDEGVFIITDEPLPVGSRLHLMLSIAIFGASIQLAGRVAHNATPPKFDVTGMGVVFEASTEQRRQLTDLLQQIEEALRDGRLQPFVID